MPWRDRLVLGYHAVSPTWPTALSIEPARLDAQLGVLVQRGYVGATFTEAVTAPPARKTLAVTFDDGFRSVFEYALPILSRHRLVGTVFVPTDYVGRDGPLDWPVLDQWIGGAHEHELTPMSWTEIGMLAAAGWEIASHTSSHRRLPRLDDESLRAELEGSRRECEERLGVSCRSIAYPYGEVDSRVMESARRAGYLAGAALPARIHRRHRFRWPRVGVWHNDPPRVFRTKASPIARRRLDLRTGGMSLLPRWRCGSL
jgi:peptidoglycan/xylan/chitin deacetylase (PgdA/CDA1 family)